MKKDKSNQVTFENAVGIWPRILAGDNYMLIARDYGLINIGRISEIKSGKLHLGSYQEAMRRLRKRS